jgi:signal transduction histidine kinase
MDSKRPSASSGPALPAIPLICYALLIAAWIVDLLTPQLFVAAILLNGPIALSGLALRSRLTINLVILAQIANVVAGYVNGVQAHYYWDPIAVGDRILSAASFLLVGYLTIRAQEYARSAGSATERARIATGEKALRRSLETIRATLNVELVLRAIVREARALFDADEALLIVRASQLHLPDIYRADRESKDVALRRDALDPAMASFLERESADATQIRAADANPIASMLLDSHHAQALLSVRLRSAENAPVLFLFARQFSASERLLQAFADGASVALEQAQLFMQLGYRNEQIAAQRDTLERRSRVIRDIVYALAHDLRTPLHAANLTMQQALDGKYGELPEQYKEILRTSLASNIDERRLVDTLLLIARFESGESSTRKEPVHMQEQLARVAGELRPIADVKGVNITIEAGSDAVVTGDESELRRAITNLAANAIEATPQDGNVRLRVGMVDSHVQVSVEDDGYGVPVERREQLFERFAVSERSAGGGTGLGLYIVRLIAQKYDGAVTYEPREPHGSVFRLTLRASESHE